MRHGPQAQRPLLRTSRPDGSSSSNVTEDRFGSGMADQGPVRVQPRDPSPQRRRQVADGGMEVDRRECVAVGTASKTSARPARRVESATATRQARLIIATAM